ncbi:unnamed protein product [Malus baccata var. baccata]
MVFIESDKSKLFTMEMHHGGHFIEACNGTMTYVGGHVAWFDNMNCDLMSRWDIENYAKKLGYTKIAKYYYTLPNDRTYKPMVADSDFWTLATLLPLNRVVLVYIVDDVQLIN